MRPFTKRDVMITPIPKDFSTTDFIKGVTGPVDTRTGGKLGGLAAGGTVWYGEVTGTSCYIRAGTGGGSNRLYVSIDNGTSMPVPYNDDKFTIFENLPEATYRILVAFSPSASSPFFKTTLNNILTVHGFNPTVNSPLNWTMPSDGNILNGYSCSIGTAASGYTPPTLPITTFNVSGSNVVSMKIKTSATKMVVVCPSYMLCVSVDGGAYTSYYSASSSTQTQRIHVVPMDGKLHTYHVWQDFARAQYNGSYSPFMLGIDAPFVDCGDKRRLDQFGSSSTAGAGATGAQVDTMITAATLGLVGSTYGISGENLAGFAARVDACLAQKVVASNDICCLQLGANDTGGVLWNATQIANYNYAITAMVNKGYGKIFCRGLPTYNGITRVPENNSIISIVNNYNNPKVIYVNTDTWSGITVLSDVHPTAAGYILLASYAATAYAPLI